MSTRTRSSREYQHRILVVYPSIAMGSVALVYLYGYLQFRVAAFHPDVSAFEAETARVSDGLDSLMEDAVAELRQSSRERLEQPAPVRDSELAALAEDSRYFRRLALVDTFGMRLAGPEDCAPPGETFGALLEEALTGVPVLSSPYGEAGDDTPDQAYVLLPLLDVLGQPGRVLIGELMMEKIWPLLEAGPGNQDAVVALLDHAGNIVFPPSPVPSPEMDTRALENAEVALGQNAPDDATPYAVGRIEADDARSYFYVAREARLAHSEAGSGWTVLMLKPYGQVGGLIRRNAVYNSLTALITIGLISMVGVRMHRRVYDPLASAVKAAGKVAKGQLNVSVPEEGPTEVRKIGEAINHMVAEVRYHRHTMSRMVKTRTESIEAARKALEQNMHQLQASYDSAQDAVLIVDILNGEILQANRQLADLFELGDVDLKSLTGDDFCNAMRDVFSDAADFQNRWEYYTEHPDSEGTEEWTLLRPRRMVLSVYTSPVRSGDERSIIGRLWTFKDLTDQRQQEDMLRQSQKMDAMSHLAGSLAHDFNNLLTVILGNLSIARLEMAQADEAQGYLEAAEQATHRATDLAKQLLGFSRRARLHLKVVNLNEIVSGVVLVLRRSADPRITVELELSDGLWNVPADHAQFDQVLMNLSMNALDAMPTGGTLILRTENVYLETGECEMPSTSSRGEYVRTVVEDTGMGMPGHVCERIFEPLFTTKDTQGNQGLGLAMVYGAVSKHGGWITCRSTPGKGTQFSIYLQRTEQRKEPMMIEKVSRPDVGRNPLVLVVDDEAGVRRIATSVLKRGGFVTVEACDGEEAVRVYREQRADIAAVLLDLSMPKLPGREAFVALKQIDADLPILICSGYPVDREEFALETGFHPDGVIQKPFNVMAICDTVAGVLNPAEVTLA